MKDSFHSKKMLPEWMVEVPHHLSFRQHFLDSVLSSIGLSYLGCGNGKSKVSAPLVEGRNHSINPYFTLMRSSFSSIGSAASSRKMTVAPAWTKSMGKPLT